MAARKPPPSKKANKKVPPTAPARAAKRAKPKPRMPTLGGSGLGAGMGGLMG